MKTRGILWLSLVAFIAAPALAAKPVQPPPAPTVSGMKVYSAGQPVGFVLSQYRGNYGDYLTIISATGYAAEFMADTGEFITNTAIPGRAIGIFYTGTNCNGDAYTSSYVGHWKLRQGMVFRFGLQTYYSARNPQFPFTVQYYSTRQLDGTCGYSSGSSLSNAVPVFPNDPEVTGIPSEGLSLPIIFGIP